MLIGAALFGGLAYFVLADLAGHHDKRQVEALREDALIMSRETARTEGNLPILLDADPWDLIVLDEAHAARRGKQEEG